MIEPIESAEEWAKRYKISIPDNAYCRKCGRRQYFTIPFAHKDFRGLMSSHVECGEEFRQYVFVPSDPEERKKLGDIVGYLFENFSDPNI